MNESRIATPQNTHFLLLSMGGAGGHSLAEFVRTCALNPTVAKEVLPRAHMLLIDTDIKDLTESKNTIEREAARVPGVSMPPVEMCALGNDIDSFEAAVDHDERSYNWDALEPGSALFDAVWTEPRGENRPGRIAFRASRMSLPPVYGAGQCPMVSSYLFMKGVQQFDDALARIQARIPESAEDARVRIVFVTSLAGGTGRGCWWLAALRARRFFPRDKNPMGIFLDWSSFQSSRASIGEDKMRVLKTNSLTGFAELAMWLRLSANEQSNKVKYQIPRLDIPHSRDAAAAIADSEWLASPSNPQLAEHQTGRYPIRRAFVVTGQNEAVVGDARQAAASILMGLIANAKSDSSFSNETNWFGTGMTSFAAVPLNSLKEGVNHLMRAQALESSLLAVHERDQVRSALEKQLQLVLPDFKMGVLSDFAQYQQRFGSQSSSTGGSSKSLWALAIEKLRDKAKTLSLHDAMKKQKGAKSIPIPKDIFEESEVAVRSALDEARRDWLREQGLSDASSDVDEYKKYFIELLLKQCMHGDGEALFSVRLYREMLEHAQTELKEGISSIQTQLKELAQASAHSAAKRGQTAKGAPAAKPEDALRELITKLSRRSGLVPVWPLPRFVPTEMTAVQERAQFEFVRANARKFMELYQRMLEEIEKGVGLAKKRAATAEKNVVESLVSDCYGQASQLLGVARESSTSDKVGEPRGAVAVGGACVLKPRHPSEYWLWMDEQIAALRKVRGVRRFVLPVLVGSVEDILSRKEVRGDGQQLAEVVSGQSVRFLQELSYRPSVGDDDAGDSKRRRPSTGFSRTAEDVEGDKFSAFAERLRIRAEAAALSEANAAKFDGVYTITTVLREWAALAGKVYGEGASQKMRAPVEKAFEELFGFPMSEAEKLSHAINAGQLLYRFARRMANDNDAPVKRKPRSDGFVGQDKVVVQVPSSMQDAVEAAKSDSGPKDAIRRAQGYAISEVAVVPLQSDHLIFASSWLMESKATLDSDDACWRVWDSFDVYTEPDVINKYLKHVDEKGGSSVFREPNDAIGIGYAAPMFLRRPEFASLLWRPWIRTTAAPKARRRAFALLYGMLGITEGLNLSERSSKQYREFIAELGKLELSRDNPELRWSMPLITFQSNSRKEKSWVLGRCPFAAATQSGLGSDVCERDGSAQSKLKAAVKDYGGPVEFARAFESGKLDDLVTALLEEQALLLELAKRSPLMELWTDGVRRSVAGKLSAVITARRAEIGKTNAEHQRVQEEFFQALTDELDRLVRDGRGVLDAFQP